MDHQLNFFATAHAGPSGDGFLAGPSKALGLIMLIGFGLRLACTAALYRFGGSVEK